MNDLTLEAAPLSPLFAHRSFAAKSVDVVIDIRALRQPRVLQRERGQERVVSDRVEAHLDHGLDPHGSPPEAEESEVEEHLGVRRDVRRQAYRSYSRRSVEKGEARTGGDHRRRWE
jgi:hypothetical protein